ncbi:hypothetical protein ColKHC_03994 [Colletotrichum higginsianum]|nr:hypothetical protein ColKHC_03994 [Colletotrichum higginsianum]
MPAKSKQPSRKGKEVPARCEPYDRRYDASPTGTASSCYTSSSTTAATGPSPPTEYDEPTGTAATKTATATATTTAVPAEVKKCKSIRSEGEVTLQGPLRIAGSVAAGGNATFNGDFDVRDRVEAYGAIEVNGNLVCEWVPLLFSFPR